jgi:DNA-binding PadR family transcriptional regulator
MRSVDLPASPRTPRPDATGFRWLVDAEGTVYPALHRLEADGLLSSEWSVVGGRRRRVYSITNRGTKKSLEAELAAAGIPARRRARIVGRGRR